MRLLVDHGAYYNLGDIAMLEGVVSRLAHTLPEAEICVIHRGFNSMIWDFPMVSRQAEYVVKPFYEDILAPIFRRKVTSIAPRIILPLLGSFMRAGSISFAIGGKRMSAREFCRKFDALHISGGGNLTDTFLIELLRKCCLILTFAEQGKPVVLTGQQLGPFRSPVHKKVLSRTLREVRFVGLREPIDSLTFCRQAHLGPGNFDVMGDDSFGILPSDDSLVTDLLAQYSLKTNEFLAFNLRVSRAAKENVSHVQQVAELIDKTAKQFKMSILIVPISLNPWQSDTNSGKKLAQLVRSAHVLVLENNDLTPALAKGVLGKAFGAVGVSYHFCTFALSQGVPAVCIYDGSFYTQKARGLCGFWGDERLALPLKGIDADLAVGQITRVFEDRLLRQKIGLIAQQAVERWPKIFDRHVQGAFGELFD